MTRTALDDLNAAQISDYARPDWDGDGAFAITDASITRAKHILASLPGGAEISPAADGSICCEWDRGFYAGKRCFWLDINRDQTVYTLAVDPEGRVNRTWLPGDDAVIAYAQAFLASTASQESTT